MRINGVDYIPLTDLAKYSNLENPTNENFNFTKFSEIKNK